MAERLGEALLELRTDDKRFNKDLDRNERNTRRLGKSFDVVGRKAVALGRSLAIAAASAGTGLGLLVKRTIDHADAMSKAAQRAGVTTEALSQLAWAGELSDVSLEKLTNGLQRLSYNMGQAATGADKTLALAFKQLGIEITNADGSLRSADEVLLDIADRFASMEDGADKTAVAMRIFGRAGGEMITLLNNGRDGLKEMADEADRLGVVISTDMGRRAEAFNDTLTRIKKGFEGIVIRIAEDLLPQLQEFADWINDPAVVQDAEAMARGVVKALGWIADAVRTVVELLKTLGEWWGKLKEIVEWAASHDLFGNPIEQQQHPILTALENAQNDPAAAKTSRLPQTPAETSTPPPAETEPPPGEPFKFSDLTTGSSDKTSKEEYDELTASALQFIETQGIEQQALGMTAQAAAALRYEQELLNQAKQADIDLTPEQEQELRNLAVQMAAAEAATGALADSLEFRSEVFRGFFTDLKSGLQEGKGFWESFRDAAINALDKITDKIFDQLLDALGELSTSLSGLGSGGGGTLGSIGGIIAGLFSGFFAKGGLIPAGTFGIVGENGPEPVIGTSRGAAVLPNSSLGGASSRVDIVVGLDMDSAGNIVPAIQKVSQDQIAGAAPAIIGGAVQQTNKHLPQAMAEKQRRVQ